MRVIDPVAVANIEALLAAIPPDCVLHEPRIPRKHCATEVDVSVVWDPPWDPSRMSEEARVVLNMF